MRLSAMYQGQIAAAFMLLASIGTASAAAPAGPADAGRVQQRLSPPTQDIQLEPEAPLPRMGGRGGGTQGQQKHYLGAEGYPHHRHDGIHQA